MECRESKHTAFVPERIVQGYSLQRSVKSEKKQTSCEGTKIDILAKLEGIHSFIEPLTTLLGQASGINWQDMQVNFKWRKLSEMRCQP